MDEAGTAVDDSTARLGSFQLKPKYLKGEELFCHVVKKILCDVTLKCSDPSPTTWT
jgi:hypothetical protein